MNFFSDQCTFTNTTNLPNNPYGTFNINGATQTRCWTYGRKNDTNHHHVPEDKIENGRICVPESLHFAESRYVKSHCPGAALFEQFLLLIFTEVELEHIQERYVQVLRSYLQHISPHNSSRLSDLLAHIPEVISSNLSSFSINSIMKLNLFLQIQTAANLLLESKMFYVPFVLNSATTS